MTTLVINAQDFICPLGANVDINERKNVLHHSLSDLVKVHQAQSVYFVLDGESLVEPWIKKGDLDGFTEWSQTLQSWGVQVVQVNGQTAEQTANAVVASSKGPVVYATGGLWPLVQFKKAQERDITIVGVPFKQREAMPIKVAMEQANQAFNEAVLVGLPGRGLPKVADLTRSEAKALISVYGGASQCFVEEAAKDPKRAPVYQGKAQARANWGLMTKVAEKVPPLTPQQVSIPEPVVEKVEAPESTVKAQVTPVLVKPDNYEALEALEVVKTRAQLDRWSECLSGHGPTLIDAIEDTSGKAVGIVVSNRGGRVVFDLNAIKAEEVASLLAGSALVGDVISSNVKAVSRALGPIDGLEFTWDSMVVSHAIGLFDRLESQDLSTLAMELNLDQHPSAWSLSNFDSNAGLELGKFAQARLEMARQLWASSNNPEGVPHFPHAKEYAQSTAVPLARVLGLMERTGIVCDVDQLTHQKRGFDQEIKRIEGRLAAQGIPVESLTRKEMMNERLKAIFKERWPKKLLKVSELKEWSEHLKDHPHAWVLSDIQEHQAMRQMRNTFIKNLEQNIDPETKRIHAKFFQTKTRTGRLSSADPNLQNLPVRTDAGKQLRGTLLPGEGKIFLALDYSQIELRVLAQMSGDKKMVAMLTQGGDIHRKTAAEMFGIEAKDVTDAQRKGAKSINFGILYGMGPQTLAAELGVTQSVAKDYQTKYFNQFPEVKEFRDRMMGLARRGGAVPTHHGRLLSAEPHKALNYVIQGTAAEVMSRALVSVHQSIKENDADIVSQIHDEMVVACSVKEAKAVLPKLVQAMEAVMPDWEIPLVVSAEWGRTLGSLDDVPSDVMARARGIEEEGERGYP